MCSACSAPASVNSRICEPGETRWFVDWLTGKIRGDYQDCIDVKTGRVNDLQRKIVLTQREQTEVRTQIEAASSALDNISNENRLLMSRIESTERAVQSQQAIAAKLFQLLRNVEQFSRSIEFEARRLREEARRLRQNPSIDSQSKQDLSDIDSFTDDLIEFGAESLSFAYDVIVPSDNLGGALLVLDKVSEFFSRRWNRVFSALSWAYGLFGAIRKRLLDE